jgi:hypothetical protein
MGMVRLWWFFDNHTVEVRFLRNEVTEGQSISTERRPQHHRNSSLTYICLNVTQTPLTLSAFENILDPVGIGTVIESFPFQIGLSRSE